MKKEEIYFVEKQRLPLWIMALLLFCQIPIIFIFYKEPIILCYFIMFLILTTVFLWFFCSMQTHINSDGIYVKMIFKKYFDWKDVEKAYVRKYKPLSEYGGWGYKINIISKNGAINMRGNIGLQLELKNGKRILIGTQRPQEIDEILKIMQVNGN